MPLRPGMNALITARLPKPTFHEDIVTGRRYAAGEAREAFIVQETAAEDDVLPRALAMAAPNAAKSRAAMKALKQEMYRDAIEVLEAGAAHQMEGGLFPS